MLRGVPRRVRVQELIPEPLELEMPDGKVATIADLGVEDMIVLYQMEAALSESDTDEAAAKALVTTRDFVCGMIAKDNPGVFPTETVTVEEPLPDGSGVIEVEKQVPLYPNWPPQTVLAIMAAIGGDESIAAEVRKTIVGGEDEVAAAREQAARERQARIDRGEDVEDEPEASDTDPLDSTKPSPTSSSSSDDSSAGGPNGGDTPPGGRSGHTSDTYAVPA
jgi:hypothetical protein